MNFWSTSLIISLYHQFNGCQCTNPDLKRISEFDLWVLNNPSLLLVDWMVCNFLWRYLICPIWWNQFQLILLSEYWNTNLNKLESADKSHLDIFQHWTTKFLINNFINYESNMIHLKLIQLCHYYALQWLDVSQTNSNSNIETSLKPFLFYHYLTIY